MGGLSIMQKGLKAAGSLAGAVGKSAIEAVFPAKCLACGEFVEASYPVSGIRATNKPDDSGQLKGLLAAFVCQNCLTGIHPAASPLCDSCGLVFASRAGGDHVCEACTRCAHESV